MNATWDPERPEASSLYVATLSIVRERSWNARGGEIASTFPYSPRSWHFTTNAGQDWIAVVSPKGSADASRLRKAAILPSAWVTDGDTRYAVHVVRSPSPRAAEMFLVLPWLLEAQVRVLLESTVRYDPSPDRQTEAAHVLEDPDAFAGTVSFWRGRLLDDRAEMLIAARGSV